jgi:hypothetical protein
MSSLHPPSTSSSCHPSTSSSCLSSTSTPLSTSTSPSRHREDVSLSGFGDFNTNRNDASLILDVM